jgi:hypothetical protein
MVLDARCGCKLPSGLCLTKRACRRLGHTDLYLNAWLDRLSLLEVLFTP